jgi:hypothetical protein
LASLSKWSEAARDQLFLKLVFFSLNNARVGPGALSMLDKCLATESQPLVHWWETIPHPCHYPVLPDNCEYLTKRSQEINIFNQQLGSKCLNTNAETQEIFKNKTGWLYHIEEYQGLKTR